MEAPFSALAFKVMSDPFVRKLTYFRVYSGTLKSGDRVLDASTARPSASAASCRCTPNHREEREEIGPGEEHAPQADDDRRHPVGRERAVVLRVDDLPEPP